MSTVWMILNILAVGAAVWILIRDRIGRSGIFRNILRLHRR